MKKIILLTTFLTSTLFLHAGNLKCDNPKESICIKITDEPLYARAYIIKMKT